MVPLVVVIIALLIFRGLGALEGVSFPHLAGVCTLGTGGDGAVSCHRSLYFH